MSKVTIRKVFEDKISKSGLYGNEIVTKINQNLIDDPAFNKFLEEPYLNETYESHLSSIRKGHKKLSNVHIHMLMKIALVCNCSLDELTGFGIFRAQNQDRLNELMFPEEEES